MPDDPLEVTPTNLPPKAPPASRKVQCCFCECVMTADGQDIWHLGEKAKQYQKMDERMAKKDEEIAKLNDEIRALKEERDALKGGSAPRTRAVGRLVG